MTRLGVEPICAPQDGEPLEARRLGRNWRKVAAAMAPLGVGLAAIAVSPLFGTSAVAWVLAMGGLLLTLIGGLSTITVWFSNPYPVERRGKLEVSGQSVRFSGHLLASKRDLTGALVIPSDGEPGIRLQRRFPRPSIDLRVGDETSARRIISALGFGAERSRASFRFASRARSDPKLGAVAWLAMLSFYVGMPLIAIGFGQGHVRAALALIAPVLALATAGLFLSFPTHVEVGTDGILFRWAIRQTYVPFADITSVERFEDGNVVGVKLGRRRGRAIYLPIPMQFTEELNDEHIATCIQRIRSAHAVSQAGAGLVSPTPPPSARRGEELTPRQRIERLRAIGAGGLADHRTPAVGLDTLLSLAQNAAASPTERGEAAIAFAAGSAAGERVRLAEIADATADPTLREILELAAEEEADEEALASALVRLAS